jgi:L-aspartate oxidase
MKAGQGADNLDLLVVGSGIAGLFGAITAFDAGQRVALVTKSTLIESNTRYAQGGIAVPIGLDDSPDLHAQDTLRCGAHLNDNAAVDALTSEAADCLEQLIDLGIAFDRQDEALAATREAAHSVPRVIHAGGDATGLSIATGLTRALRRRRIPIFEGVTVTDLVVERDRSVGADVIDAAGTRCTMLAARVLLATGGAGQLFSRTTNPSVATGDGLALAFRAGAELMDLEFFQFHPTAVALKGRPAFLISEAARGEGAVLRNQSGRRFAFDYHPDGEVAPRDVVARAIWSEMAREESRNVLLDLTHSSRRHLQKRFPTIWRFCSEAGIDISTTPIPVAPAAHYFMGGIRTDVGGRTSLPGLFAAGEVACTGVHGANRLASNSLLEGLVFGRRAALVQHSTFNVQRARFEIPGSSSTEHAVVAQPGSKQLNSEDQGSQRALSRTGLQQLNWRNLGLVRDASGLERALAATGHIASDEIESKGRRLEDDNLRLVSRLMAQAALLRTESRGAHYRDDFPQADENWRGHIILDRSGVYWSPVAESRTESVAA